jgi:hypothetical protein
MGWDFEKGATKKSLVEELTVGRNGARLVAKRLVGQHLWVVWQPVDKEAFIALYLLRKQRDFGWGYKSLAECEHPYYYTCPVKFLDLAPVACAEWRELVLERAARKSRTLKVGVVYELPGRRPDRIKLIGLIPLLGRADDGRVFRLKRSFLGREVGAS